MQRDGYNGVNGIGEAIKGLGTSGVPRKEDRLPVLVGPFMDIGGFSGRDAPHDSQV